MADERRKHELRAGVVGAGTMGAEIALVLARAGAPVVVCDVSAAALDRAQGRAEAELDRQVARGAMRPEERGAILGRMAWTAELPALAVCSLVVEAVVEDLATKQAVFADLDGICPAPAILATNTSSFLVADLAAGLAHPERVLGLHFFYPPLRNRLVEVVSGLRTVPALVRPAIALLEAAGKVCLRVADSPGFCVNRFFVPWLNEAVRIRDDTGHGTAQIDAVARDVFGCAMGPFALMNATGVPIAYHAARGLAERLGPAYAPARGLGAQVESGQPWDLEEAGPSDPPANIAPRLLAAVWHEAKALVGTGICARADVNLGAQVGLRWKLGPFDLFERTPPDLAREWQLAFLRRQQVAVEMHGI